MPRDIWVVYNYDGPLISFDTEDEAISLAQRLWPSEDDHEHSAYAHVMHIYHYGLED